MALGSKDELVCPSDWISIAALWTIWKHVGKVDAVEDCRLLEIDASKCMEALAQTDWVGHLVRDYAKTFHARLVGLDAKRQWVDDLSVPNTEFCDIVSSLRSDSRTCIGLVAIEELRRHQRLLDRLDDLANEVRMDRCTLLMNQDNS